MLALVDFTAENGATRVAPGSHLWDRGRTAEPEELVAAEMPAGSAVIYLGSTIHGGGANTTADKTRQGMHVSYCLGWLHTEENQYLATPLDVVRTLPRESQALLGYAIHDALAIGGGYLGAVELQDPVELLGEGRPLAAEQRDDLSTNSSSWRRSSATGQMNTRCTPASRNAASFSANASAGPTGRRSRSISSGRWIVGTSLSL